MIAGGEVEFDTARIEVSVRRKPVMRPADGAHGASLRFEQ
jgi:hypothetical protein